MNDFLSQFTTQMVQTSPLEWCAVVLAIAYVVLAAKQNPWCWLCAFCSTAIYTWLFWQVTLPFQSVLNLYYMFMAGYGYYQWKKQTIDSNMIVHWSWSKHIVLIPCLLMISFGLAVFAENWFTNSYLMLDAMIHVFSLVTTFMVAHKILQNWLYWFVINLASAWLYWKSGLALSSMLFLGYVGFSVYGYVTWLSQWNARSRCNAEI